MIVFEGLAVFHFSGVTVRMRHVKYIISSWHFFLHRGRTFMIAKLPLEKSVAETQGKRRQSNAAMIKEICRLRWRCVALFIAASQCDTAPLPQNE